MLLLPEDDGDHHDNDDHHDEELLRQQQQQQRDSFLRLSMRSDSSLGGQASLMSSRHSDFTLPTSNRLLHTTSPPLCLNDAGYIGDNQAEQQQSISQEPPGARRPIFPTKVQNKYVVTQAKDGLLWPTHVETDNDDDDDNEMSMLPMMDDQPLYTQHHRLAIERSGNAANASSSSSFVPLYDASDWSEPNGSAHLMYDSVSPLPSPSVSITPSSTTSLRNLDSFSQPTQCSDKPTDERHHNKAFQEDRDHDNRTTTAASPVPSTTSHVHAQSLLVALAVAAVWTPSNLLAPNLTLMARDLHIHGAAERDLYLGSYMALASSVLSAPMGAGISLLADLAMVRWRRRTRRQQFTGTKNGYGSISDSSTDKSTTTQQYHHIRITRHALFCWTVAGGAVTAWLSGSSWCTQYWQLLLLRIMNGGLMTGAVPVAFSIMADWFSSEQRNAASSGLTAMMGVGMIGGQIYAGMTGPQLGWRHGFRVSGVAAMVMAVLCFLLVQEPERGGKEKALKDMIQSGKSYEKKLTWSGFWRSMRKNKSNMILIWQGFFSSVPWGIISVFLNDYLSQERGFTVADATFMVVCFGVGCAFGGILGGIIGQRIYDWRRSWLPLFMAVSTVLGMLPFVLLLNTHFTNAHGPLGLFLTISGGLVANLPSVNSRPCLINVNPPESRGAALTASNVLVNLGRGFGPSAVTLMVAIFKVNRQFAFNVTLIVFWSISAIQLVLLSRTLPRDQDAMESELVAYAMLAMEAPSAPDESMEVSIQERMTHAFDERAARETLSYVQQSLTELRHDITDNKLFRCAACQDSGSEEEGYQDDDCIGVSATSRATASRPQRSYSEGASASQSTPLNV